MARWGARLKRWAQEASMGWERERWVMEENEGMG